MHYIETLYVVGAIVAILASYPQLRLLIKMRASDEFNVGTWATWLVTQCFTLLYAATIGNVLMIMVSAGWVGFYFAMTVLIVYYHPRNRARRRNRSDDEPSFTARSEPTPAGE